MSTDTTSGRSLAKQADPESTEMTMEESNRDALYEVLHDTMQKDMDTNILLGNVPLGDAEEIAAGIAFAEHTRSPVLKTYYRQLAMAKRAERAGFRKELFSALKTIGRREDAKPSILSKFGGG